MGDKKATAAASEQQLAARQPPTTTKKHVKQARSAGQESVKQEHPAAEQLMNQVAPIGPTRTPMEKMYTASYFLLPTYYYHLLPTPITYYLLAGVVGVCIDRDGYYLRLITYLLLTTLFLGGWRLDMRVPSAATAVLLTTYSYRILLMTAYYSPSTTYYLLLTTSPTILAPLPRRPSRHCLASPQSALPPPATDYCFVLLLTTYYLLLTTYYLLLTTLTTLTIYCLLLT